MKGMNKMAITGLIISFFFLTGFSDDQDGTGRKSKDFYRTFEIIEITANGLTIEDNDGNVIEVDKDPNDYKIGYKVRYDSVRNRLRPYRWQDYTVLAITTDNITLEHKTGDILSVKGYYTDKFKPGDQVRYDSVGEKLQPVDESGKWKQYEVVAANNKNITLKSRDGEELVLYFDNNLYPEQRGIDITRYKVGDLVRYNSVTNNLKKGVIRTYDWQDYEIKKVSASELILVNAKNEELVLKNTYGTKFTVGDPVKYDRLNNILKKTR